MTSSAVLLDFRPALIADGAKLSPYREVSVEVLHLNPPQEFGLRAVPTEREAGN